MDKRERYWRRTRRMTAILLSLWGLLTFCIVFFARDLDGLFIFGWPLNFYLAAQGASLAYLAIIAAYGLYMRRADRDYAAEAES
ncbi:MAG TPA: sodium/substrate symporter small subunit [Pseudoduganella sp.]